MKWADTELTITKSTCAIDSAFLLTCFTAFRNPGNICLQNLIGIWNPEFSLGICNIVIEWNLESKFHYNKESRIQNPRLSWIILHGVTQLFSAF